MAASLYDFSIEQGSSFKLTLVYKDTNSNPVDIRGWCARLTWTTNVGDTSTFTTENSDYSLYNFNIVNDDSGTIIWEIPAAQTNLYTWKNAKYDFELQSITDIYTGGGKFTSRILYGTTTIVSRYSKSTTSLECQT